MPPKRRSAGVGVTTSNGTQSTLSFNNRSRVTKQSNILPPSEKKATTKRLSDQAQADLVEEISDVTKPSVTELEIESNKAEEKQDIEKPALVPEQAEEVTTARPRRNVKKSTSPYDRIAKEAEKVSDAKIKAYWKAEEDSRIAPRIHQQKVHLHEKILRHFDLSSQYGPCIGIERLARWKRAFGLGMDPPVEVLAVLLKEEAKGTDRGQGGRQCGRLAYIDELAGGRVVLVE